MNIDVGVVGATGLVGEVFLRLLTERRFPLGDLRLFASDRSAGQVVRVCGRDVKVRTLSAGCFDGLKLVFFSSGDDISREWAPQAVASGAFAVDNSAAFRMDPSTALVVPEVNAHRLPKRSEPAIIANPNCSTIQLVMMLKPLLKNWGIESVHVASYQSVSGAGRPAREELLTQVKNISSGSGEVKAENFPHQIAFNVIPQIGSFNEQGYCSEEWKIIHETKKILEDSDIRVSAFTVRVPVVAAHSEAVWVRLKKQISRQEIVKVLENSVGLKVIDDPVQSAYPMPIHGAGRDEVFVGRIHQDVDDPQTWLFWVVSDNLRKGAALNGIQIAEKIF